MCPLGGGGGKVTPPGVGHVAKQGSCSLEFFAMSIQVPRDAWVGFEGGGCSEVGVGCPALPVVNTVLL